MKLGDLAEALGGRDIEGDVSVELQRIAALEDADSSALVFVRNEKFVKALAGAVVGAVIAPRGIQIEGHTVLRSDNPSLDFARAAHHLHPSQRPEPGIHPRAYVDPSAEVAASASIGPLASVGPRARIGAGTIVHANVAIASDVVIGRDCVLHLGCCIREGSQLGDRTVLQPGCVIGGDGFGFEFDEQGELVKVPQLGSVILEEDIEVGANSTIDRARLGVTRIGRGTKIDNLVQIAHNVQIGNHCVFVSQSGVAGSTKVGNRVFLMGQVGVSGHLEIGDGVFAGARSGIIEDVEAGSRVWGFPAVPERTWHRSQALLGKLSDLMRRIRRLEKRLGSDDA